MTRLSPKQLADAISITREWIGIIGYNTRTYIVLNGPNNTLDGVINCKTGFVNHTIGKPFKGRSAPIWTVKALLGGCQGLVCLAGKKRVFGSAILQDHCVQEQCNIHRGIIIARGDTSSTLLGQLKQACTLGCGRSIVNGSGDRHNNFLECSEVDGDAALCSSRLQQLNGQNTGVGARPVKVKGNVKDIIFSSAELYQFRHGDIVVLPHVIERLARIGVKLAENLEVFASYHLSSRLRTVDFKLNRVNHGKSEPPCPVRVMVIRTFEFWQFDL